MSVLMWQGYIGITYIAGRREAHELKKFRAGGEVRRAQEAGIL